jgi:hypothetical protein
MGTMHISNTGDLERVVIELISTGAFDEAVLDRMHNDNKLIDRFCDGCDQKCSDNCEGRRYRV